MIKKLKPKYPPSVVLALLLSVCALPFLLGIFPTVRFTREQIDIRVFPTHIIVTGRYVYKNNLPVPSIQGFSIPFHIDGHHPPPVHVSARVVTSQNENVPIHYMLGAHRFDLVFKPYEQKAVEVTYRQAAPAKRGYYLLRTTKPWRRPLLKGIYRLMLNGVELVSSSYPLKPVEKNILAFSRKNFMPENDWQWEWQIKNNENQT